MSQLVESIISGLRGSGLDLRAIGDGWFALQNNASAPSPEAFLYLTEADSRKYLDGMSDEDVDGAFGEGVQPESARYSLIQLHLEEALRVGDDAPRYVVVEGESIRIFNKRDSLSKLPPGDYEWRAAPR